MSEFDHYARQNAEKLGYLTSKVDEIHEDLREQITKADERHVSLERRVTDVEEYHSRIRTTLIGIKWVGIALVAILTFQWTQAADVIKRFI